MTTPQTSEQYRGAWIQALLVERAECDAKGQADRVAAIDQELRQFGAEAVPPARRATRRVRKGDEIG